MHYKLIIQLVIILLVSVSCSGQRETESGITYEVIKNGSGEVPEDGGKWMLNMAYYKADGEKLFSTADQGGAMAMEYRSAMFTKNASFEECFSLLGEGDSIIFYVSADSLFKNSYRQPTPPEFQGTTIKLCIGVEEIFTMVEYENKLAEDSKERMNEEKSTIEAYLQQEGIVAEATESGLYYQITEQGDGAIPEVGQKVLVNYTGALLDGTVFDTSREEDAKEAGIYNAGRPYGPLDFALGKGRVIRGWDIGIGLLQVGTKAKLIIPSPLAYGERGQGGVIKPNSILVFDVELVDIVE
jgi:FKBP-type peptidyl-prolyl cis-trans isomerase